MPQTEGPIQLRRRPIDDRQEHAVLRSLITDDRCCRELQPLLKPEHFTTPAGRRIAIWIKDYFALYNTAPGRLIEDIYRREAEQLDEIEASLIATFLSSLSEAHEQDQIVFNSDYAIDQAMSFFDRQSLFLVRDNLDVLLRTGRIEQAKIEVANYRSVSRLTGGWVNPLDPDFARQTMTESKNDNLMKLPGVVGDMMGWLRPGWLVGVFAPPKRGKTSALLEYLICALTYRLPVAFISHEMNARDTALRFYKRITAMADRGGNIRYPCLDCHANQDGTCNNPRRENAITLLDDDGNQPMFTPEMEYRPCTACRESDPQFYVPATWHEVLQVQSLIGGRVVKHIRGFATQYGRNNLRCKSYPPFSANIKQMKNDLDLLEYTEGWIPRVIINDYADIVAPEDARLTGRERTDETWKAHKNMADTRKCIVVTASQTNRASIEKRTVKQIHAAEDIRKINHVDVGQSLNQTDMEKRQGLMRFGIIAHRHRSFHESDHALVLQEMRTGQFLLASVRVYNKWEKAKEGE